MDVPRNLADKAVKHHLIGAGDFLAEEYFTQERYGSAGLIAKRNYGNQERYQAITGLCRAGTRTRDHPTPATGGAREDGRTSADAME
jgi:hypothetical protein